METTKVLLSGCNGCMGSILRQLIAEKNGWEVVAGFDKEENPSLSFPVITSPIVDWKPSKSDKVPNVIIDFSAKEATEEILSFAERLRIPIVIATTGIAEDSHIQSKIIWASSVIPIFQSANMSFDICLISNLLKIAAVNLTHSDIEILERHHNRKKDAPSGTALMLAKVINEAQGNMNEIVTGRTGKRNSNEIGVASMRGGDIAGVHEVTFYGEYEDLTIIHTCHSRKAFAEGAIKAAEWLMNQKAGLYDMNNLLG